MAAHRNMLITGIFEILDSVEVYHTWDTLPVGVGLCFQFFSYKENGVIVVLFFSILFVLSMYCITLYLGLDCLLVQNEGHGTAIYWALAARRIPMPLEELTVREVNH